MNRVYRAVLASLVLCSSIARAQSERSTRPDVGIRSHAPQHVALINAHIVVSSRQEVERGTIVIRDGRIVDIGSDVIPPAGSRVIDCAGDRLYPAFIDALVEFESKPMESRAGYWNEQVMPERLMSQQAELSADKLEVLRESGIAVALVAPNTGLIKGRSCVVLTSDAPLRQQLLREDVFQHVRMYPERRSRDYPNSPMGAVALIRQALSDALWYGRATQTVKTQASVPAPEFNAALMAMQNVVDGQQKVVIDGSNELYALRADRLAREFSLGLVIRGSGREYRRLDAIAATAREFILPVDFPDAPEVGSQQQIADATLQELMHWRLAPENPARLDSAGVSFAFTSDGSDDKFLSNVRIAVARGLSPQRALDALTITPARLLGIDSIAGTLERGRLANILRTDGELFAESTELKSTWIAGVRHAETELDTPDLSGTWEIELTESPISVLHLRVSGKPKKPKATIGVEGAFERMDADEQAMTKRQSEDVSDAESLQDARNEAKPKAAQLHNLEISDLRLSGSFNVADVIDELTGEVSLSGAFLRDAQQASVIGTIRWPDGSVSDFRAEKLSGEVEASTAVENRASDNAVTNSGPTEAATEHGKAAAEAFSLDVNYPLGAYGRSASPKQPEYVLIKDATVWTCADNGILESADMLICAGTIVAVGSDLEAPENAEIIDASGMHLTPGIIDCHSHMATDGGVNESGQAVTAEVRIGDFIDPNDINIYRQLAGGVTTSNILHGSANPIGGQNQVIKLRWGALGDEMKMKEAPGGIKFALGENVKQSNRGEEYTTRYPQTRMGVEQIMRDRFEAAKLYRQRWRDWRSTSSGLPPRRDYELEAIAEILEGNRWIHCHSYRQDEILTMLRTLEDYDVTIGSLQHILEGYKVAEVMAAHGATGSSFSDWWAYKFEVYDGIPHNGAIMHRAGIVVSFNSDDRELARHLNHEAAKAVKYGGVSPEEALKFVTLNPAKQLRIDRWVGSLEAGKHADFVLWNRSPLSTLSACQQTWVDGRKYFDREEDLQRREHDQQLHRRLVQLVVDSNAKTSKSEDDDPSFWWARYDEFCHHNDAHDHDEK